MLIFEYEIKSHHFFQTNFLMNFGLKTYFINRNILFDSEVELHYAHTCRTR